MPSHRILVVEDEPAWVELLKVWFRMAGYSNVDYAETGAAAMEMASQTTPECVILDLVLPDQSGLEICRKLRSMPALSQVPVVLLTCHTKEKVLGLQSGADYFVAKSEKPHELMATLEAVFRRKQSAEGVLKRGELMLRAQDRQVFWKGAGVVLTPKMFILFHILVERSPQPVSRADLYRLLEGAETSGTSRALVVLLNRLKKTLPEELRNKISNVKNFGYVFLDPAPPPPPSNPK